MKPIIILICFLGAGFSGQALGQTPVSDSQDHEARQLFEAGEVAFADGRFENALRRFKDAYELSPRPQLLFNIGASAERLRRDEEALDAYQAYLEAMPDAPNRAQVEARIDVIEQSRQHDQEVEPVAEAESASYLGTWLLGGATVALAGAGVAARLLGDAAYDELLSDCTASNGCTEAQVDDSSIATWDGLMVTSFVLAGTALVGMVFTLILTGDDDDNGVAIRVSPQSVMLEGSF